MNVRHLLPRSSRPLFHLGQLRSPYPRLILQALLLSWLLCLVCTGVLRAQDSPNDNPTGPTGDYNGEVTTGGSYDPYTQNAKRQVTDLVVPGSNGTYPLVFTRTYNSGNSTSNLDTQAFGDNGKWRHSYMWTLTQLFDTQNHTYAFAAVYPDGRTVTFRKIRDTTPTAEIYWRGPTGVQDRLEVDIGNPSVAGSILHLSDGGRVTFLSNKHAATITDPYGATTKLQYVGQDGTYLTDVIEPGGRSLHLNYGTATWADHPGTRWTVLTSVVASTGQQVTFQYQTFGIKGSYTPGATYVPDQGKPYCVLTGVVYNYEGSTAGGNVQAAYTYLQSDEQYLPVLQTAVDPHYAGAMTSIRYVYADATFGMILEEQNINANTHQVVSHVDRDAVNNVSVETRGDLAAGGQPIKRTFKYAQVNPRAGTSDQANAKRAQLTTASDYQGNNTYLYYYDHAAKDSCGEGNLLATVDALGNRTLYNREPITGKVNIVQLPDGRQQSWLYWSKDASAANGGLQPYYLLQSTDERGKQTNYTRYPNTGLVHFIDYPDGSREEFQYTPFTRDGGMTYYCKLGYQKTKLGAQIYYGYGANDASGHNDLLLSVTRYYNDGVGHMVSETTNFEYDAYDRLKKTTDPRGVVTSFAYNARHQLATTIHGADNTHVDRYYDDYGNCTDVSDEMGHTVHTTYDEYRRPLQVRTPINDGTNGDRFQTFAYDPRDYGSISISPATSHTRAQWSVSWRTTTLGAERVFSPNGWLKCTYNGIVASGDWTQGTVGVGGGPGCVYDYSDYSSIGQLVAYQDTQGQTSTFAYNDPCGRKTSATDPNNHTSSWAYYLPGDNANFVGWLKSVTVPGPTTDNGGTVTTQFTDYDVNGHVKSTVDPANHTFVSGYDSTGNLTSQSDGAQAQGQHVTGYGYDQLGRKVSITNPATGAQERWTYDESGNVKTYRNYAGRTCTYQYDGRNRCQRYDWDDGATSPTGYGYDAASRVTDVNNWHANVHYTFNDAGEVTAEQITHNDTGATGTTRYYRDGDGNVVGVSYPSGFAPQFAYDAQARCTGVYSGNTTISRYTFSGNWLTGRAMYNGLCTTYQYQANGRCWDVWHRHGDLNSNPVSNKSVSRHLYGYEPNGQISWFDREADGGQSGSSLENGNGDAFAYFLDGSLNLHYRNMQWPGGWPYQGTNGKGDSKMDIANPTFPNSTADTYGNYYDYDGAGNRVHFTYHNQPQPTYAAWGDNEYTLATHDNNFNTTLSAVNSNTDPAAGWSYTYDAENHLTGASKPGVPSATFAYDGLGRLCVQNVGGVFKRFYYVGSQRGEERDYNNNALENYMYDAPGNDRILYRQGQYGGFWYQYDLMGNVSHVSDSSGTVVEQYLYDAYGAPSVYDKAGNARPNGSAIDNRYLFKGAAAYEWMPTMGLYYARARFYLPYHGRWLQPDPIGQAGGLNIYTYCGNDPVNGIDPSGLESGSIDWRGTLLEQTGGGSSGGYGMRYAFSATVEDGSRRDVYFPVIGGEAGSGSWERGISDYSSGGSLPLGNSLGPVGSFVDGFARGELNVLAGLGKTALRPWTVFTQAFQNAQALYQAAANPSATWDAVKNTFSDPHSAGEALGNLATGLFVGAVAAEVVPLGSNINCFVAGTQVAEERGKVAIESIQVGERVTTKIQGQDVASRTTVDPQTWKEVVLCLPNSQCAWDTYAIHTLRSNEWMEAEGCTKPGDKIWFEMDEVGIQGWAEVQSINACPPLAEGNGQVVLTTFNHFNTDVYKLSIEGETKPIEVTGLHRLYSATQNEWVHVNTLHIGERLRTQDGERKVVSLEREIGTYRVYNLEVEADHCYFVSDAQVLAHNAGCDLAGIAQAGKYDTTVGSMSEARQLAQSALPHAMELPAAVEGLPYPKPPPGVKAWFRVEPAEPGVGNNLPHVKYADWTNGKKGSGGSWGHIFFNSND